MATLRQVFGDIADSIRSKGVEGTMKPVEMASKIDSIQTGGGNVLGIELSNLLEDEDGTVVRPSTDFNTSARVIGTNALKHALTNIKSFNAPNLKKIEDRGLWYTTFSNSTT